jgi:hypothetical protein
VTRRATPQRFKFELIYMPPPSYQKVFDQRKRRVRGLWKRNGWFYPQLSVVDHQTGHRSSLPDFGFHDCHIIFFELRDEQG